MRRAVVCFGLLLLGLPWPGEATVREVLPNGLRVLIRPNPATEVMAATVLLAIPASAESAEEQGIRALTQRLLLRGTTQETGEAMGERLAAVGGSVAANVGLDYVELTIQAPVDGFEVAMELLAEALQSPAFAPEEVAREKGVLCEDLRARAQDPFQCTYQALREELYGRESYGRWSLGDVSKVPGLTREQVEAFYRAHYAPEAAVLSIAGGVEEAPARRVVRSRFGAWHGAETPEQAAPARERPLTSSEVVVRESPLPQLHLALGFPAPAVGAPRYYAMQVIDSLLGGGETARLPAALRGEAGLVYDVSTFYPTLAGDSHFGVYAVTDPEQLQSVKRVILRELERLREEPVPPTELARAKRALLGTYALSQQSSQAQAYSAAWYELLGCGPDFARRYEEQVNAVTAGQVQEAAQALIHHFILALTVPSV